MGRPEVQHFEVDRVVAEAVDTADGLEEVAVRPGALPELVRVLVDEPRRIELARELGLALQDGLQGKPLDVQPLDAEEGGAGGALHLAHRGIGRAVIEEEDPDPLPGEVARDLPDDVLFVVGRDQRRHAEGHAPKRSDTAASPAGRAASRRMASRRSRNAAREHSSPTRARACAAQAAPEHAVAAQLGATLGEAARVLADEDVPPRLPAQVGGHQRRAHDGHAVSGRVVGLQRNAGRVAGGGHEEARAVVIRREVVHRPAQLDPRTREASDARRAVEAHDAERDRPSELLGQPRQHLLREPLDGVGVGAPVLVDRADEQHPLALVEPGGSRRGVHRVAEDERGIDARRPEEVALGRRHRDHRPHSRGQAGLLGHQRADLRRRGQPAAEAPLRDLAQRREGLRVVDDRRRIRPAPLVDEGRAHHLHVVGTAHEHDVEEAAAPAQEVGEAGASGAQHDLHLARDVGVHALPRLRRERQRVERDAMAGGHQGREHRVRAGETGAEHLVRDAVVDEEDAQAVAADLTRAQRVFGPGRLSAGQGGDVPAPEDLLALRLLLHRGGHGAGARELEMDDRGVGLVDDPTSRLPELQAVVGIFVVGGRIRLVEAALLEEQIARREEERAGDEVHVAAEVVLRRGGRIAAPVAAAGPVVPRDAARLLQSAVGEDQLAPDGPDVGRALQRADGGGEGARQQLRVVVEAQQMAAAGAAGGLVDGPDEAPVVGVPDHPHAVEAVEKPSRLVVGRVVDDQDLERDVLRLSRGCAGSAASARRRLYSTRMTVTRGDSGLEYVEPGPGSEEALEHRLVQLGESAFVSKLLHCQRSPPRAHLNVGARQGQAACRHRIDRT